MKMIIFLLFLFSTQAEPIVPSVKQFKLIQRENNKFYLIKKRDISKINLLVKEEKKLEIIELNVSGSKARLITISTLNKAANLYCVIYSAGESGTSLIVEEHRCALYNTELMRFEGDFPFQYLPKTKDSSIRLSQPEYKVENKKLKIFDNGVLIKVLELN